MSTIKKVFTNAELCKKIFVTVLMLIIFRLGCSIPIPYISTEYLTGIFGNESILSYMNMLSGGALGQCAIFALGVSPYINSTIIIELLTFAIPQLKEMGQTESGKKDIDKLTKLFTLILSAVMACGYLHLLNISGAISDSNVLTKLIIITCFVAGSQACMFIGNVINESGLGDGISLLIFAGIISGWGEISTLISMVQVYTAFGYTEYYFYAAGIAIIVILSIIYTVYIDGSFKKIPVAYSGNKGAILPLNNESYLPMKLIMSGVIPIIFASTLLYVPTTIAMIIDEKSWLYSIISQFTQTSWAYIIAYVLLIFGFNYFYSFMQFNPTEMANNLRLSGATIPGFRPGAPTEEYLKKTIKKLSFSGSIALSLITVVPLIVTKYTMLSVPFVGSSLLIVCGVALQCVATIKSYAEEKEHGNFLKRSNKKRRVF